MLSGATAPDDSTVVLRFAKAVAFPDVLTDLAILPAHLLDTVPHARLRQAEWNRSPVGNGPFRFVAHEPNRRWVFATNPDFPAELGGPPALDRFIVVVVDEPTTKLAALVAGEIDFAGINPAHAAFVRRHTGLAVIDYPLLFPYGLAFNTRRPPLVQTPIERVVLPEVGQRKFTRVGVTSPISTRRRFRIPATSMFFATFSRACTNSTRSFRRFPTWRALRPSCRRAG